MNNILLFNDFYDIENVFHKTPEGYLTGNICITGIGVFSYMGENGKIVKRLRRPETLRDSTILFNNKPITLYHPKEDVTSENAEKLSVGLSSNNASFDGYNSFVTVTITNKKAVEAIENKEVEAISCGYEGEVVSRSGNWHGIDYDQELIKIINCNHIALVKRGRAGDSVIFKVGDSMDNFEHNKKENNNMKTFILDGVQYEAAEEVISELKKVQKSADEATKKLSTSDKEKEALKAKADALEAELKKLKEKDQSIDLDKMVSEKLALIDSAKDLGCEVKAVDSSEDIKKAVIAKAYDSIDLKDKSQEYVSAMYDAAVLSLSKSKKTTTTSLDSKGGSSSGSEKSSYEKHYDSFFNPKKEG